MLPEFGRSNTKIGVHVGLIPENTVLQLRRLARIVNHKTLVVLCALVHNLAEELKRGECGGVIVKNTFSVVKIRFAENEYIVYVRAERRLNTQRILHSNQKERLQPTAVHEKVANILVVSPAVIIHTVIQNHKRPGVYTAFHLHLLVLLDFRHDEFLALHEIRQNSRIELAMNEEGWNHFSVEGVGLLRATDHGAERHVLVMEEEIPNEGGFARSAPPDENHYGILGNPLHIKPFYVEIYVCAGCHV